MVIVPQRACLAQLATMAMSAYTLVVHAIALTLVLLVAAAAAGSPGRPDAGVHEGSFFNKAIGMAAARGVFIGALGAGAGALGGIASSPPIALRVDGRRLPIVAQLLLLTAV
mmetsp:Transcript_128209/g.371208  ORF Transcript_128209/g.371208 Transcript_128209/m.371208 type:complete len:112 (+) Transcript_128209:18-353(+)